MAGNMTFRLFSLPTHLPDRTVRLHFGLPVANPRYVVDRASDLNSKSASSSISTCLGGKGFRGPGYELVSFITTTLYPWTVSHCGTASTCRFWCASWTICDRSQVSPGKDRTILRGGFRAARLSSQEPLRQLCRCVPVYKRESVGSRSPSAGTISSRVTPRTGAWSGMPRVVVMLRTPARALDKDGMTRISRRLRGARNDEALGRRME